VACCFYRVGPTSCGVTVSRMIPKAVAMVEVLIDVHFFEFANARCVLCLIEVPRLGFDELKNRRFDCLD
jgi:hypothetical protein